MTDRMAGNDRHSSQARSKMAEAREQYVAQVREYRECQRSHIDNFRLNDRSSSENAEVEDVVAASKKSLKSLTSAAADYERKVRKIAQELKESRASS